LPVQKPEQFKRLEDTAIGGARLHLDVDVRNNGPGGLARVPLNVRIEVPVTGPPHGTLVQLANPQSPVRDCKVHPGKQVDSGPITISCTIANLRSGATARQTLIVTFFLPGDASRAAMYLRISAFPATSRAQPPPAPRIPASRERADRQHHVPR
jgi:hypothetical protein